jgi:hypothetical protein
MSIIDDIIAWALANTLKALWRILNAIVFFFPNAIMNLLLTLLGWGAAGPIGGFCTSYIMIKMTWVDGLTSSRFVCAVHDELLRRRSRGWVVRDISECSHGWLWCYRCRLLDQGLGRPDLYPGISVRAWLRVRRKGIPSVVWRE